MLRCPAARQLAVRCFPCGVVAGVVRRMGPASLMSPQLLRGASRPASTNAAAAPETPIGAPLDAAAGQAQQQGEAPPQNDRSTSGPESPSGAPVLTAEIVDWSSAQPMNGVVEQYSYQALKREGRENQIASVDWREDTHYPPILARGAKSVYDYTDDIPRHVKPLFHYQMEQHREYFRSKRDTRPFIQRVATFALVVLGAAGFVTVVAFTRVWFEQPKEIQQLRNRVLSQTYGKVLELAASTGTNIGNYPYAVSEIVMCDTDATALQRIRYRIPKTGYPKYHVYQERAEYLTSFADGEFDCVIDMFGLCHYRDPVMALRQMQRVCKPTGTILLLEHGRSSYPPVNWFLDYFADRHNVNAHGCAWNRPILDFIKEARLVVKERESLHYGTTHYVVTYPEILPTTAGVSSEIAAIKAAALAEPTQPYAVRK